MLVEAAHGLRGHGVAVRGVGPLVGKHLDLARGDRAVLFQPGDDVEFHRVPHAVCDKGFLPGAVDADGKTPDRFGTPGTERFVQDVLLVAEAAADIGLDDMDITPRTVQRLTDDTAYDVGDLGARDDDQPAVFRIGKAAVVFDVTVLDGRHLIPALDFF